MPDRDHPIDASGSRAGSNAERTVRSPATSVRLRACIRLLATAAHLLHGVVVCLVVLPRLSADVRQARIARWSARLLRLLGVRLEVRGALHPGAVLLVANHVSWLDIVAIQALAPVHFVARSDLRRWFVVGYLAACAGTLFLERRDGRAALRAADEIADCLRRGGRIVLFPEGTTGTGQRVLPFHAGLLQSAIAAGVPVQPVALRFSDPGAAFSTAAQFVGATTLVMSLWRIASADGLIAHVALLPPVDTAANERRVVARDARDRIQRALDVGGA